MEYLKLYEHKTTKELVYLNGSAFSEKEREYCIISKINEKEEKPKLYLIEKTKFIENYGLWKKN